jgi:hypothetical protein
MELMEIPVKLKQAQIRKIQGGGAIGLKPANFGEGATHTLAVMRANLRKIANANRKNKGVRLQLKPGENVMVKNGGSILGDIKRAFNKVGSKIEKVGSKIEKVATSKPVKAVGRKIASTLIKKGIPIATSALGSAIGSSAATISGNPELAPVAGKVGYQLGREGGMELSKLVSRKTGFGMMYVPMIKSKNRRIVGPGGVRKMTTGEGFLPAGDKSGSGIAVVAPSPPSDVIQTGSPYAKLNSAAMNPFIAPSIQLSGKKIGAGFMPAGGV